MPRKPKDFNVCYKCKLGPPLVQMSLVHGRPRGICNGCRSLLENDRRNKQTLGRGFYKSRDSLTQFNSRALASLSAPAAYPLIYLNSGQRIGYIVLKLDSYLTNIWGNTARYAVNQYGMAMFLSNQGLSIGADAIEIQSAAGEPLDLASLGTELTPEPVEDKLIMFDLALQRLAIAKVKADLGLLKVQRKSVPTQRMGKNARTVPKKR